MKISLNWIKQFVDLEIVEKTSLNHVVVGYVESLKKHPNAGGLNVAQVNVGDETLQIVCGGANLVANTYVPVAKIEAILPGNFEIKRSKIRDVESHGMICAKEELKMGRGEAHGIWILNPKKKWAPGTPLLDALKLNQGHSPQELSDLLTLHTSEVEEVIPQDKYLNSVVTGKLISFEKIKDSDKLHVGQFDLGWKTVQIVFGSVYEININEILAIALPGAVLPGGAIKRTEIQGIKSEGMVCGDDEIGIQNTTEGITRFPAKTPLGAPIFEILKMNDTSLDIDNKSLTHRPDLWGHYGLAREFAAILKKPLKPLAPLLKYEKAAPKKSFKINIKADKDCPRFSGCVVTNVQVTESPQWMKSFLQAAGLKPINNLVDLTNYVMLELGEPMHAYDRNIVGADELTVRHAKKGETLETIDHKKRKLTDNDLVIANKKNDVLGLAGLMGGVGSEITDQTTEIILEAANFNPVTVRKMSTRHGLRSDASQRFEKGLDPNLTEQAIARALVLLKETCPDATLVTPVTTTGTWKAPKIKIKLNTDTAVNKIGTNIPATEMVRILKALDFKVERTGKTLNIQVPTHRATGDVSLEEDIIEEIARLYGYDNIEPILPKLPAKLPRENEERIHKHDTRDILAHTLGFTEVMNYSFYNKELFHGCGLQDLRHIKVLNPLSSDQTHMRVSLIPGILQSLVKNSHERDHLTLFEIGRTYKEIGEYMPLEEKWLAAVVAQRKKYEPFYEAKAALQAFLEQFRPANVQLKPCTTPPPYAHPKKCLEIVQRGETIGYVFELHPGVANTINLEHRAALFELNFTKLVAHGRTPQTFQTLPKFPGMSFDVSFLIDRKTQVADLEKTIRRADPLKLIQSVQLFDMYQGKGIPDDKKSLAFGIELRHNDHTLTDKEFQQTHQAVLAAIQKTGGEIRK